MTEYIDKALVCYQLEKQASIDGQPRAIRRARRIVESFPAADVIERPKGAGCMIDGEALLDRFEKESAAADKHGRDFSTCFMRGGEPCTEWWAVMQIVQDVIDAEKAKRGDYS